MFIVGKASEEEIKEMIKLGFDVENVDVRHFDMSLMGDSEVTQDNEENYKPDRYEPDKLVAVFIDYDIAEECRTIAKAERDFTAR